MKNEYKNEYKVGYTTVDSNLNLSLLGCATIIQDMVTELFEYLETDNRRIKDENNAVWVLTKLKIHFEKYPIWKQNIQATSFITNKSKIRVQNNTKVEDETGSILFVAKQESCPLDLTSRRIRKIETIRFPLDLEIKKPILEEDFEKLNNDFRQENIVGTREVYYSDTDYSKHTNNVSYVRFIMNMINSEILNNNIITDFEISYINESKEGQLLDIYRKDYENKIDFLIKIEENELVRARIKLKEL